MAKIALFSHFSTSNDPQRRNISNFKKIEPLGCSPEFWESVACHVGPGACISPEEIELAQDRPRGKLPFFKNRLIQIKTCPYR